MNNREKILGGLVLAIVVGLGARSVHNRLDAKYRQYASQEAAKDDELFREQIKVNDGMRAVARLAEWRERSLPSDPDAASVKYLDWLRDQMEESGLPLESEPKYTPERDTLAGDGFRKFTWSLESSGSLEDITDFLYRFYRSNHLHKISRLEMTPEDESGGSIRVGLTVEAWSLADADRVDALAEGESDRLAHDSPDHYRDSIGERNIFAAYVPRPNDDNVVHKAPPFDHAEHAVVNGIVESGGKMQVWINVRSSGEKHRLYEGESLQIGDMECRIVEIGIRDVVFEAEGQQYSVKLGRNLREGKPVDTVQTENTG